MNRSLRDTGIKLKITGQYSFNQTTMSVDTYSDK